MSLSLLFIHLLVQLFLHCLFHLFYTGIVSRLLLKNSFVASLFDANGMFSRLLLSALLQLFLQALLHLSLHYFMHIYITNCLHYLLDSLYYSLLPTLLHFFQFFHFISLHFFFVCCFNHYLIPF